MTVAVVLLAVKTAQATHYVAGEITYRALGGGLYEVRLVTYTDTDTRLDHPTATIIWGDGDSSVVPRARPKDINFQNKGVDRNVYIDTHRYDGGFDYRIGFFDRNRIAGIVNIEGSVDQAFYIQSRLILNNPIGGNNSPILQQPPLDDGCTGQVFEHNPTAYDPDGDSLAYELVTPLRSAGQRVSGYINFQDSARRFDIDPVTGQFEWNAPRREGIYNIAILIKEYRDGELIGSVLRDMQINISGECENQKPDVFPLRDTCVEAGRGNVLDLDFSMTDPDTGQTMTLSAFGSPLVEEFVPNSTATLTPAEQTGLSPSVISSDFRWEVTCAHIRSQPYRIVVRGEDDVRPIEERLVDLETFSIRVIGPPPENLSAKPSGDAIILNWDPPACSNALAYNIYRAVAPTGFDTSFCQVGIPPGTSFRQVGQIPRSDSTSFVDDNLGAGLSLGTNYCYRVTAIYRRAGEVEFVEGYASNEACSRLRFDRPILTNVDVVSTDAQNGEIQLRWANPNELDTTQFAGDYRYELYRVGPPGDTTQVYAVESSSFAGLRDQASDTTYLDRGLNTQSRRYTYFVRTLARPIGQEAPEVLGDSPTSTSLFLRTNFGDEELFLNWSARTTWVNDSFAVLRRNPESGVFSDTLGVVRDSSFTDSGLVNGREYCYKIVSYGSFGIDGIDDPTINRSQISCEAPKDTIGPCAPDTVWGSVNCNCERDEFPVTLFWQLEELEGRVPECSEDVVTFQVYFAPAADSSNPVLLKELSLNGALSGRDLGDQFSTTLMPSEQPNLTLPGYFYIAGIDSFGNIGPRSAPVALQCTPEYRLPNIFTPNGDRYNQVFRPIRNCFVESIDMRIFNRWGELVHKTQDPEIRWNGFSQTLDRGLEAGTYYYECVVNERRLDGLEQRTLRGSITISY